MSETKTPGKAPVKKAKKSGSGNVPATQQGENNPGTDIMTVAANIEKQIAAFSTIEDHLEGKNQLEAMRLYAQKKKVERSLIQRLAAGNLKISWRMGRLLAEILKPGRRKSGENIITLEDLNISRTASHRYQEISSIPEDVFEERIQKLIQEDEDLTEAEFYKFARSLKQMIRETPSEAEEEDGTARMEAEQKVRDDFLNLSLEMIHAIREKQVPGVDKLTDDELNLVTRAIVETVTIEAGPIKKQIDKFQGENALDESNYWTGLKTAIRQLAAVHLSLRNNTTPASPKALLMFNENIGQMIGLLKSWDEKQMDTCPDCGGSGTVPGDGKKKLPCPTCINGKVGWFRIPKE